MWALIVCYYPDYDVLCRLISTIIHSFDRVMLLDNGGTDVSAVSDAIDSSKLVMVQFPDNLGLGGALNRGFALACESNAEYIVTFDQDSIPLPDHAQKLLGEYLRIKAFDKDIAAIGPTIIDNRDRSYVYKFIEIIDEKPSDSLRAIPPTRKEVRVLVMVQSGMLIPVSTWKNVAKYDEHLFIEFVDTDWCYRVNDAGFSIYGTYVISMYHEVSDGAPKKFFGFSLLTYSPIRRYYFFRNVIYMLKRHYVPRSHKFRLLTGMLNRVLAIILLDEKKVKSFLAMLRGLRDGVVIR